MTKKIFNAANTRMEIAAVTINMSGRGVLGVTPKYKVDMVETFLKTVPDIIFLQVLSNIFILVISPIYLGGVLLEKTSVIVIVAILTLAPWAIQQQIL
jgi:hypothetical protein